MKATQATEAALPPAIAHPGAVLRRLRTERQWTLADVSRKTGLTVSALSKIENGRLSLSYDKLARLSTGLGIDIGELFDTAHKEPARHGRRSVTRAGAGEDILTDHYRHHFHATDVLNKRFVPVIVDVTARTLEEFGELIRHDGEEWAYVLEGEIEFHTALYAPIVLHPGDSVYFDSGMGHAYIAQSRDPCRFVSICSGPEALVMAARRGAGVPKPASSPSRPARRARDSRKSSRKR
jgi:transcriptional regulator with XRE-family HTH domain